MTLINCAGVDVGVATLSCISSQSSYVMGYVLIAMVFATVFFRLSFEPMKVRLATSLLITTITAALFSVGGALIPQTWFFPSAVLFVGALFLMMQNR